MTESAPLPSLASTPEAPPATRGRDLLLALVVVAFAFLAASFAARNSDLFLHLASGRLLAHGDYTFGVDPFAYTTEGVYWANHSWLFDLAFYAGHHALGGAGLVLLKAGAVALLAALMLRLARSGNGPGPFWVAAGCTLLAVLAMSPRLLLQPACLSLLLLGVCLWLLRRGGRALLGLPVVVVLWVNLDTWFLLGPLLVALFGLGQLLAPEGRRLPLWLMPVCLLACLLNPHHVHALALPAELSPAVWQSAFRHDARFAPLFASPWRLAPLGHAGGYSLAAWAYFLLLALGIVSFAVNRTALRGWRGPVWLAFALLGAWQVRLVPFFAVVAGPVTALNFGECLSRRALPRLGPAGVLLGGLTLVALTWPGWLQGFHRRDRALAWAIHTDPSLRRVAATLGRWRRQGILPSEARTFATHPDVAHYGAWFCPEEKCFLDSRLPLFLSVAADYQRLGPAVGPASRAGPAPGAARLAAPTTVGPASRAGPSPGPLGSRPLPASASGTETDTLLRAYRIACVVLYDPDLRRLAPGLRQVVRSPQRWALLRVEGDAVVVGCKGAGYGLPASLSFDAEKVAFAPAEDVLPPAPDDGPAQLAEPFPWWHDYLDHPGESSWEAAAAAVYLRLFEEEAPRQFRQRRAAVLPRHAAGLAALPALPAVPPLALASRLGLQGVFLSDLAQRSPALPLLAVRAARRAVAAHPDDASAWLVLAQAYLALGRATPEAVPFGGLPVLNQVRHVQTATALVQAVTLRPDLAAAHEALAWLYADRRFLDLALRHRSIHLRLTRSAGPLPGESPDAFAERLAHLEQVIEQTRVVVEDNENRFVIRTQTLAADPLARAHVALQLGLAGKALDDVLLRSSADLYGVEGLRLLLKLLLLTGRAHEARLLLDRDEIRRNPNGLGFYDLPGDRPGEPRWSYRFPAYDWFDFSQAAAAGHYARAARALERMRVRMKQQGALILARLTPATGRHLAAALGLHADPTALAFHLQSRADNDRLTALLVQNEFQQVERADLHVLDGMLLLERGLPVPAGQHFRLALPLYQKAAGTAPALPGKPLAIRYISLLRRPTDG